MPRYIDADKLLTDEKTHTLPIGCGKASGNVVVFVDDIEKLPAADVAPRAEVERQKVEIEALKIANEKMYSAIEETKAEVAREIFEEIEKIGVARKVSMNREVIFDVTAEYNELKKKYTKGENNH